MKWQLEGTAFKKIFWMDQNAGLVLARINMFQNSGIKLPRLIVLSLGRVLS
jgi:hypothetical protein